MNIGINLVDFTPGRMGGVETYVRNLITWLAANDHKNKYTLICTDQAVEYFNAIIDRVETLTFTNNKRSPQRLFRSFIRKALQVDIVQIGIDRLGLDVVHNPFTKVRSRSKTPLIVTFHDLQHHYHPEFFKPREIRNRDRVYGKAALEADCIIAVSDYTKQTVLDCYKVPNERVHVVPLGVGDEYHKIADNELLDQERYLLGLTRPFIYYPAATWLHKNHLNLLRAVSILNNNRHFDGDLVLTGISTSARDGLLHKIAELGLTDRVHILGYLPYDKLPVIYNLARMMVFPSLFEGFGMPVLEAMACGCPVACSDVTSLPEVGGDAAHYFDPLSAEQIADTVIKLWNDETELFNSGSKGIARANFFNWERTARETLGVYHHAVGRPKHMS